jgi:hypothetical protein
MATPCASSRELLIGGFAAASAPVAMATGAVLLADRLVLWERIRDGKSFRLVLDPLADDLAARGSGCASSIARAMALRTLFWRKPCRPRAVRPQPWPRASCGPLDDCDVHAVGAEVLGLELAGLRKPAKGRFGRS